MTFNAKVKKAFSSQSTLMHASEHCSLDPEQLLAAGLVIGRQVRVRRSPTSVALYTVSEDRPETDNTIVRMAQPARARLSATGDETEFAVSVDTEVPRSALTDYEAQAQSEFVERLTDNGTQKALAVLAPHGGSIEHFNEEAGAVWLKRLTETYRSAAWINPTPEAYWGHSASTAILKRLMDERMYPLTLDGLDEAMRELSRKR